MNNKLKLVVIALTFGWLMFLASRQETSEVIAIDCCQTTECDIFEGYSNSCVGVGSPCPPNTGTCYWTLSSPRCTSWSDWGACGDPEPVLCYTTRWCLAPSWETYLYQISQCTCGEEEEEEEEETCYVNCSYLMIDGVYTNATMILTKGDTYTLSAQYDFCGGGTRHRLISVVETNNCDNRVLWLDDTTPPVSFSWTPTATGTYTVYCLNSEAGYNSCSGYRPPCDMNTGYACGGPHTSMAVEVIEPPPSTGTVQGYKVIMPGNQVIDPAREQTVLLDGKTRIAIKAYGTPAGGVYPSMDLRINGSTVKTWSVTGTSAVYDTYVDGAVDPAAVSVWFTNDLYALPEDRNLMVDFIKIGSVAYQTENLAVYSEGSWAASDGCAGGYKQSEWLHCNGHFQYSSDSTAIDLANSDPYDLTDILAGSHTVSTSIPAGYFAGYTLCYSTQSQCGAANDPVGYHSASNIVSGSSVSVNVPADGWADLWWHYTPPSCYVSTLSTDVYVNADVNFCVNASNADQGAEIWKSPTATQVWTNVRPKTIPGCSLTSFDQIGTYYVDCNAFGSGGGQCSGNPWCEWLPNPPNTDNCTASGWVDCGPDDLLTINVINPDPWWQADKGNIHADGGNVVSPIPVTATLRYLITGGLTGLVPGLVSYTGSLDIGSALAINQNGSNWRAKTSYQGFQTGYGYFEGILHDDPGGITDWPGGGKPDPSKVVYAYTGGGEISTSGSWTIADGESLVILVDGNITIGGNITVTPGGFLAIIASGDITIGNTNTVTNVQGVYIADGIISSGNFNSRLIAEGIFVGWDEDNDGNGINLQRDLADNSLLPAEKFIYRPDLVRNAYRYLLKPKIAWQEVAP